MLPPDRMHLFHQGLFRHLLKWIFELLELRRGFCRKSSDSLQKQQKADGKGKKKQRQQTSNGNGLSSSSTNSDSNSSGSDRGGGGGGFSSEDEPAASGSKRNCQPRPRKRRTCKCCVHTGAATVDVDSAFMSMNTCASTPHTRFHYAKGISESSFINNKHVRSALEQHAGNEELTMLIASSSIFILYTFLSQLASFRACS